uniref:Uncharacterized protein n=1 Tax=Pelusios castaneus TaxID=367368 RepID=A0A8C8S197_9SAUR
AVFYIHRGRNIDFSSSMEEDKKLCGKRKQMKQQKGNRLRTNKVKSRNAGGADLIGGVLLCYDGRTKEPKASVEEEEEDMVETGWGEERLKYLG